MASQAATRSHGKKFFGRAFYESLGSPKFVLAPMVDHSEFAWRMLTRSFLPPESSNYLLAYSPMLHSRMFSDTPKYRNLHFEPLRCPLPTAEETFNEANQHNAALRYLDGNPECDRPLFVQFCSNSPENFLEAAKLVEPFCDAVDLNLGCPQGIARKGRYGAFLQEDWELIFKLINTLHNELSIPVTAKMRILETKEKTLEYAKMILSAGASIITVHGRRREQKGHYTGLADWSIIRYLRDHLPPETVIFANGNILQYSDIEDCLRATGADGVMSAEANLSDPTVFAQPPPIGQEGREYWRGRDGKGGYRMDAVLRRYMDILYTHVLDTTPPLRQPLFIPEDLSQRNGSSKHPTTNENGSSTPKLQERGHIPKNDVPVNLKFMQSHLFHLLRPLVAKHTDIRDYLAKCRAGDVAAFENVLQMVERVTKDGILDYESNSHDEPQHETTAASQAAETDPTLSSDAAVRRCKRPWWVCQPYVRPLPAEAIEKGAITLSQKDKMSYERGEVSAATRSFQESKPHQERQQDDNVPVAKDGLVCG